MGRRLAGLSEVELVETKYRRSTNTYQIDEQDDLEQATQIYDNLLLVNAYRKTKHQSDIMLFERRQDSRLHNLDGLIHAIKQHKIIGFSYQKHWEDRPVKRVLEPYAVKEFKNRWYLLAADSGDESALIKTFGLDRMTDLDIKSRTFKKKDLDLQAMFGNSFGIIATAGETPQKIVLSFDHYQGKYIKSLPLHPSQKVITESPEEYRIELTLCPTYDFYQELLTHAECLTVVKPEAVKPEYAEFLKIALKKNK